MRTIILAVALATSTVSALAQSPAPTAARVTREQFKTLKWLEGRFHGSGGGYAAFYEEYRFLNDSTMEIKFLADSTGAKVDRVGRIWWSPAGVMNSSGSDTSVVTLFAATSLTFTPRKTGSPYTFTNAGEGGWTAKVGPGGKTEYKMRRIKK